MTEPSSSWSPPRSHCLSLPGFAAVDSYPIRSPLAVADFLAPRVAGKALCEIGTRNGDIASCLTQRGGASSITAIELDHEYCKKLRARGLNVLCRPVEEVPSATLAACQVYFWWPMDAEAQNERWLRQLQAVHRSRGTNATIYVAHDTHYTRDMSSLPRLAKHYGAASIERVFFDEGSALTGQMSYSHPVLGRPGQWGVFHLARFEAGPAIVDPGLAERSSRRVRPRSTTVAPAPTHPGFCAETDANTGVGDCERGDSGTIALHWPGFGAVKTAEACATWCVQLCARCRYVSFSLAAKDCSWYHDCDLTGLNQRWQQDLRHVSRRAAPGKGRR